MINGLSTIIMPCYNAVKFLDRSIGSILAQTYDKIELIVVDDGSADESFQLAESYRERFEHKGYMLKVFRQENQGPGFAAIYGLEQAEGEYLSYLDADDELLPTSVEKRVSALVATPEINVVRTNGYRVFTERDNAKELIVLSPEEKTTKTLYEDIVTGTANNFAGTFMVRATAVRAYYGNLPIPRSDFGQNLQLILAGAWHSRCVFIDEPLMHYYIYPQTHSHKKTLAEVIRMYEGYYALRKELVEVKSTEDIDLLKEARTFCVKSILDAIASHPEESEIFEKYYQELESQHAMTPEYRMIKASREGNMLQAVFHRLLFFIYRKTGKELNPEIILQVIRFGMVGVFATLFHYFVYWILQQWMNASIAYTIGYATSFVCNFWLTSIFTFRSKATVKKGLGFGAAHLTNYFLHIILLNLFLWLGMSNEWAPIPVFCIAIPVNFLLVRFVFTKK